MTEMDAERLRRLASHTCAKCLEPVKAARFLGREAGGTRIIARCHDRIMTAIVPDETVEDGRHIWWFLDEDGEPYVSPAERRKNRLREELARVRAARERINTNEGNEP